jgi:hypothetical protein
MSKAAVLDRAIDIEYLLRDLGGKGRGLNLLLTSALENGAPIPRHVVRNIRDLATLRNKLAHRKVDLSDDDAADFDSIGRLIIERLKAIRDKSKPSQVTAANEDEIKVQPTPVKRAVSKSVSTAKKVAIKRATIAKPEAKTATKKTSTAAKQASTPAAVKKVSAAKKVAAKTAKTNAVAKKVTAKTTTTAQKAPAKKVEAKKVAAKKVLVKKLVEKTAPAQREPAKASGAKKTVPRKSSADTEYDALYAKYEIDNLAEKKVLDRLKRESKGDHGVYIAKLGAHYQAKREAQEAAQRKAAKTAKNTEETRREADQKATIARLEEQAALENKRAEEIQRERERMKSVANMKRVRQVQPKGIWGTLATLVDVLATNAKK